MVIKESIIKAIEILRASGAQTPQLDARVLLTKVLNKSDVYILTNPDYKLTEDEEVSFFSYVQRRAESEPVAYIIGEKEFMSLDFYVTSSVLVPRPDTEHLAELAINLVKTNSLTKVADFCTGTGALAITMAKYCEYVKVDAYDISPDALGVAERNKERHNTVNVSFKKLDVLNELPLINCKYQLVVSNPPYISKEDMSKLEKTVKQYEPHLALYGGEDGLDFYRIIVDKADNYLEKGGILAFEVGHNQAEKVKNIMSDKFSDVCVIKDYAGINRVVYGVYM